MSVAFLATTSVRTYGKLLLVKSWAVSLIIIVQKAKTQNFNLQKAIYKLSEKFPLGKISHYMVPMTDVQSSNNIITPGDEVGVFNYTYSVYA